MVTARFLVSVSVLLGRLEHAPQEWTESERLGIGIHCLTRRFQAEAGAVVGVEEASQEGAACKRQ